MFNRKKCKKCGSKVKDKFDFCPSCGKLLNAEFNEDFGMLGKNDAFNGVDDLSNSMFGGIGGNMLNKMLGSAMKMLEREMRKEIKKDGSQPKTNFQMFINGKKVNLGGNFVSPPQKESRKVKQIKLPNNKLKNFAKLPKENPKTSIRRFSEKIVYEIDVPGVKVIEDVSIIKLENSIEIKAVSKTKAYSKIIPISLQIINYKLESSKILIEMSVQN